MEMAGSQKYQELRNKTLPGIFLERVKNRPNEVAYRVKQRGDHVLS
jgi:tRNA (Thr-GGU) A37 N-methylase